jgi:hypothetical protein
MREPEMTPFELQLAKRLRAYSAIEAPSANALTLARDAMRTRSSGIGRAWASLSIPIRIGIVVALLASLMAGALLVGVQLVRNNPTVFLPDPSGPADTPSTDPVPVGFAPEDLRARWLALFPIIPELGDGSGPVTLTIDPAGALLTLANIQPGMSFASFTQILSSGELRLQLVEASGGCPAGSEGDYRLDRSSNGGQLTFSATRDDCAKRRLALGRTWDRTLVAPTTVGAGMVDSFEPPFAVALPPHHYEARQLTDFIDIEATDVEFGMAVVKNPQGFADSCSPDQVRFPYTPGAAAFVDYYRQNDAFDVISTTSLTIDGHDAIHLVTNARVDGARCPGADLYAWTPKECECHFFGGDDSYYLVDVGNDTFMFQLAITSDFSVDLPILESIRIPYTPGAPGT